MPDPTPQQIAQLLRKPDGEPGLIMAERMADSNGGIVRQSIEEVSPFRPAALLEAGFAGGWHVADLIQKAGVTRYCGIDISETMVEAATSHNQKLVDAGTAEFQHANVASIPYPDNTFDAVLSVNTLYFWENPEEDMAELLRVTKPGGYLFLGVRPKSTLGDMEFLKYGFTLYDGPDVEALMVRNGWSKVAHMLEEEGVRDFDEGSFKLFGMIVRAQKP